MFLLSFKKTTNSMIPCSNTLSTYYTSFNFKTYNISYSYGDFSVDDTFVPILYPIQEQTANLFHKRLFTIFSYKIKSIARLGLAFQLGHIYHFSKYSKGLRALSDQFSNNKPIKLVTSNLFNKVRTKNTTGLIKGYSLLIYPLRRWTASKREVIWLQRYNSLDNLVRYKQSLQKLQKVNAIPELPFFSKIILAQNLEGFRKGYYLKFQSLSLTSWYKNKSITPFSGKAGILKNKNFYLFINPYNIKSLINSNTFQNKLFPKTFLGLYTSKLDLWLLKYKYHTKYSLDLRVRKLAFQRKKIKHLARFALASNLHFYRKQTISNKVEKDLGMRKSILLRSKKRKVVFLSPYKLQSKLNLLGNYSSTKKYLTQQPYWISYTKHFKANSYWFKSNKIKQKFFIPLKSTLIDTLYKYLQYNKSSLRNLDEQLMKDISSLKSFRVKKIFNFESLNFNNKVVFSKILENSIFGVKLPKLFSSKFLIANRSTNFQLFKKFYFFALTWQTTLKNRSYGAFTGDRGSSLIEFGGVGPYKGNSNYSWLFPNTPLVRLPGTKSKDFSLYSGFDSIYNFNSALQNPISSFYKFTVPLSKFVHSRTLESFNLSRPKYVRLTLEEHLALRRLYRFSWHPRGKKYAKKFYSGFKKKNKRFKLSSVGLNRQVRRTTRKFIKRDFKKKNVNNPFRSLIKGYKSPWLGAGIKFKKSNYGKFLSLKLEFKKRKAFNAMLSRIDQMERSPLSDILKVSKEYSNNRLSNATVMDSLEQAHYVHEPTFFTTRYFHYTFSKPFIRRGILSNRWAKRILVSKAPFILKPCWLMCVFFRKHRNMYIAIYNLQIYPKRMLYFDSISNHHRRNYLWGIRERRGYKARMLLLERIKKFLLMSFKTANPERFTIRPKIQPAKKLDFFRYRLFFVVKGPITSIMRTYIRKLRYPWDYVYTVERILHYPAVSHNGMRLPKAKRKKAKRKRRRYKPLRWIVGGIA